MCVKKWEEPVAKKTQYQLQCFFLIISMIFAILEASALKSDHHLSIGMFLKQKIMSFKAKE